MKALIAAGSLLALAACPPKPPDPPPPTVYCLAPHVKPEGVYTVKVDDRTFQTAETGYVYIYPVLAGEHALGITSDHSKPYTATVQALSLACDFDVQVQPLTLPRLRVNGLGFLDDQNRSWRWAMTDGFSDYFLWLTGAKDQLGAALDEARGLRSNGRRVFGMVNSFRHLWPQEWANFYSDLGPFLDFEASYGQYVQFVVFADTRDVMPDQGQQLAHYAAVWQQLETRTNALLQLVNENNANSNFVDIGQFPRPPPPLLSSAGSNCTGCNPPLPVWDYADLGSERPADTAKLLQSTTTVAFAIYGYPGWAGTQTATVVSEPIGCADVASPGRRIADPYTAYLLGLGTQWGGGGTAHADNLIMGEPLSPVQKECVAAFVRGVLAK